MSTYEYVCVRGPVNEGISVWKSVHFYCVLSNIDSLPKVNKWLSRLIRVQIIYKIKKNALSQNSSQAKKKKTLTLRIRWKHFFFKLHSRCDVKWNNVVAQIAELCYFFKENYSTVYSSYLTMWVKYTDNADLTMKWYDSRSKSLWKLYAYKLENNYLAY